MLDNLTQRLSKVVKTLRGQARLTEDNIQEAMREVRMALLEADVALPVVVVLPAPCRPAMRTTAGGWVARLSPS